MEPCGLNGKRSPTQNNEPNIKKTIAPNINYEASATKVILQHIPGNDGGNATVSGSSGGGSKAKVQVWWPSAELKAQMGQAPTASNNAQSKKAIRSRAQARREIKRQMAKRTQKNLVVDSAVKYVPTQFLKDTSTAAMQTYTNPGNLFANGAASETTSKTTMQPTTQTTIQTKMQPTAQAIPMAQRSPTVVKGQSGQTNRSNATGMNKELPYKKAAYLTPAPSPFPQGKRGFVGASPHRPSEISQTAVKLRGIEPRDNKHNPTHGEAMTENTSFATKTHYEPLLESGKLWYSSKEAAAILGVSPQFVREAFDNQELMGQEMASHANARCIKLIHRDCLLAYLMSTANYAPEDFLERMKKLIARRPTEEQERIREWLEKMRRVGR